MPKEHRYTSHANKTGLSGHRVHTNKRTPHKEPLLFHLTLHKELLLFLLKPRLHNHILHIETSIDRGQNNERKAFLSLTRCRERNPSSYARLSSTRRSIEIDFQARYVVPGIQGLL